MKLITSSNRIFRSFGEKEGLRILKNAGYDSLDLTLCRISSEPSFRFGAEDGLDYAKQVVDWAKDTGISFLQSHTPYEFNWKNPNELEERFFPLTIKALQISAIAGVKIAVVHPYTYGESYRNRQEIFELNMKIYRRLIPYAKELGVKIALENMYRKDENRGVFVPSVCGTPEQFNQYIDALDSEYIVGCLDLGHCSLVGIDAEDFLRVMGKDRVKALHVSDNDYLGDYHTLPGLGKMTWDEILKALVDIGYEGDFTYEADRFMMNFEDGFKPIACRFMADRGKFLLERMKKYKATGSFD